MSRVSKEWGGGKGKDTEGEMNENMLHIYV
jgi:hypothetical protein